MPVAVNHLSVILVSQDALQSVQISQALGAFSPLLSMPAPQDGLDALQQAQASVLILDMRKGEEALFDWIGRLRQSAPGHGADLHHRVQPFERQTARSALRR